MASLDSGSATDFGNPVGTFIGTDTLINANQFSSAASPGAFS